MQTPCLRAQNRGMDVYLISSSVPKCVRRKENDKGDVSARLTFDSTAMQAVWETMYTPMEGAYWTPSCGGRGSEVMYFPMFPCQSQPQSPM